MESDTSQARPPTPGAAPAQPSPAKSRGPLTAEERAAKRTQGMIIGGAVGFLVLLVVAIVLMAKFPAATEIVRDIAIVFVAVTTFLIGLAMLLLIFQIQVLIQVLRDEIQPLLHTVNDTASTVRGTTEFVSHNVVSPIIKLAGFASAVQRVMSEAVGVVKATRPRNVTRENIVPKGGKRDGQSGE
jgi:hypothetical protein